MHKHDTLWLCSLGLVTTLASCTELTRLGVSGELRPVHNEDSVAHHYTKLAVATNEWMMPNSKLGDVDGDGLDDVIILVTSRDQGPPGQRADMTAHLFYGRAGLPEQLTLADADATFETQMFETVSLGDVNGDKLSDFVLGDGTGIEFVFGSTTRFSGHYAKFTAGHKWAYGAPPPEGGFLPLSLGRVFGLGDINGDGADEFLVEAVLPEPTSQNEVRVRSYLMEGRKGAWPTGTWDPSWAAAIFGEELPTSQLWFPTSGDVNADGFADLVVLQDERFWLFYGSPTGLRDRVTTATADAELQVPAAFNVNAATEGPVGPTLVGDIDNDGTDDFLIRQPWGESHIVYNSKARLSGTVTLQPDLTFANNDAHVVVGDYNADGLNDLLVQATPATGAPPTQLTLPVLYELRGTGTRLTGRKTLQPEARYQPVGYVAPDLTQTNILSYGDIDGDGSEDLAAFEYAETLQVSELPEVTLYLLPGSAKAPD